MVTVLALALVGSVATAGTFAGPYLILGFGLVRESYRNALQTIAPPETTADFLAKHG